MERNYVDLREYKKINELTGAEAQRAATFNPRRNRQNQLKTVYDRAVPRIYKTE